ncbi:hypothetical protein [Chlorobium sp.]|uniref:hypothetical protein n=1 Tax=Chlorobium sp. TaxID=1095 RepID=UPI003C488D0E
MIYNPAITAYVADLAESASVEIGDSKTVDFFPQAKVIRDGNAANLSLRYLGGSVSGHAEADGVVTAKVDDATVEFFDKPESGSFEIEVVLNKRPASNRFDFSIRSKGVSIWERMAEMPAELVARGAVVPEDSVGSLLAVGSDGIPIFDVKRPCIVDATGASVLGEVEIIGDVLTVIAPADFLAAAALPIRVDPTVGYTTLIGLIDVTAAANWPSFLRISLPEPAKNLVVQVYCSGSGVSGKGLLAAADGAGGVYGTLLGSSSAVALGSLGWTPFVIPGTVSAGTYFIGFVTNGNAGFKFRDASGQALIYATGPISGYYDSPTSPVPNPGSILSGYVYVMKLDYDVDTGGSGPEMSSLVTGIGTPSATAGPLAQASAEVPGIGTPSGVLLALPPASGASEVIGTSSATLSDLPQASSTIECTGQPSGALASLPAISSEVLGVGTATGSAALLVTMSGEVVGIGTVTGYMTVEQPEPEGPQMYAVVSGLGQISGEISILPTVSADVVAAGLSSGTLSGLSSVGAEVYGVGTNSGALADLPGIGAIVSVIGVVVGGGEPTFLAFCGVRATPYIITTLEVSEYIRQIINVEPSC